MRPFRQVRKNARSKPQIPKLMPLLGSSRNFTSKTHMFECGRRPTDNPAGSTRNLARMANNTDRASIPARWDGLVSEFLELVGALGIGSSHNGAEIAGLFYRVGHKHSRGAVFRKLQIRKRTAPLL